MSDLEPSEVGLRRAARERALELLYESEAKRLDVDAVLADLPLAPAPLAVELVRGVAAERDRIDEVLARRVAPRWTLHRLAAVDRAILRLGTYELIGAPDRSQAVILNEAVVLARRFGTDDSPRFVNGVLSAVARDVRGAAGDDAAATDGTATGDEVGPPRAEPVERTVDAVVIDLDGVIRHWDNDGLAGSEKGLGLSPGTILAAAFEPERLARAMRGQISADQWYGEVGAVVAAEHPVAADAVSEVFSQIGWRIDESVVELVDQARKHVPVVLLSNASTRLVDDLEVSGLLDRFDAVVGSAELGACKPDAAAFAAAVERAGVPAARCLMIDDLAENVEGARAVGMQAVRFESVEELTRELEDAGVLPPPG
jgi:putative hydrolase of the HAD superfamily